MKRIQRLPILLIILELPVVIMFIYGIIVTLTDHLSFGDFINGEIPNVIVGVGIWLGLVQFGIIRQLIKQEVNKPRKPIANPPA